MNPKRWLSIILMMGLILALTSLSAQADPYLPYYHHHGDAYRWDGCKHHDCDRYDRHYWRESREMHHPYYADRFYAGPPVAYVAPVAPVIGIPYAQPQPYFVKPGLSGQIQLNF